MYYAVQGQGCRIVERIQGFQWKDFEFTRLQVYVNCLSTIKNLKQILKFFLIQLDILCLVLGKGLEL